MPLKRIRERVRQLSAILSFVGCGLLAASAGAAPPPGLGASSCVSLQAIASPALQAAQASSTRESPEQLRRKRPPMTEREFEQLLKALEPAELDDEAGSRLRVLAGERQALSFDRMHTLVEDITAHLTMIHLAEQLDRFGKLPDYPQAQIEWGEGVLAMLDECLDRRYAPYGGSAARRLVRGLVADNRRLLEQRIFSPILEFREAERKEKDQ